MVQTFLLLTVWLLSDYFFATRQYLFIIFLRALETEQIYFSLESHNNGVKIFLSISWNNPSIYTLFSILNETVCMFV